MKAVKKMLALGITVSMLAGMAGCGSEKSKEVKEEDSKDVTLTFMASQDWVQDAEVELGKKFTEETGIKVDYPVSYTHLKTSSRKASCPFSSRVLQMPALEDRDTSRSVLSPPANTIIFIS